MSASAINTHTAGSLLGVGVGVVNARLEIAKRLLETHGNLLSDDVWKQPEFQNFQTLSVSEASMVAKGSFVYCRSLIQQTHDPEMYLGGIEVEPISKDKFASSGMSSLTSVVPIQFSDAIPELPEGFAVCQVSPSRLPKFLKERTRAYCVPIPGESFFYRKADFCVESKNYVNSGIGVGKEGTLNFPLPWNEHGGAMGVDAVFYDLGSDEGFENKSLIDPKRQEASGNVAEVLSNCFGEVVRVNDTVEMIGFLDRIIYPKKSEINEANGAVDDISSKLETENSENRTLQKLEKCEAADETSMMEGEVGASVGPKAVIHVVFHRLLRNPYDSFNRHLLSQCDSDHSLPSSSPLGNKDKDTDCTTQQSNQQTELVANDSQANLLIGKPFISLELHDTSSTSDALRRHTISVLASVLNQDILAAEYCLLSLLTSANRISKNSADTSFQFTLNLYNKQWTSSCDRMYHTLSQMLPRVVCLPMSLKSLNEENFAPCWDVGKDYLKSGMLQLSAGTVVMLDETKLENGDLTSNGCSALKHLKNLCSVPQSLLCHFGLYEIPLSIDSQVIVLSNTPSILRQSDSFIPIPVDSVSEDVPVHQTGVVEENCINEVRRYLALLRMSEKKVKITADVNEHVTQYFVNRRKQERSTCDADSIGEKSNGKVAHESDSVDRKVSGGQLRLWLALACALARSHNESYLKIDRWEDLMELEDARLGRLQRHNFKWCALKKSKRGGKNAKYGEIEK